MDHTRQAFSRLPNLLCVGVEKCGTTFLNAALSKSPDVLTPKKKELFFFNQHFDKGLDWYLSWYDYQSKPGARYIADVTPSYFRLGGRLGRISETLPDARIMVVLRHPVYRAFSHYVHRMGELASRLTPYPFSFADVLDRQDQYQLICTRYGESLRKLLEFFPRENILLLSYEEDIVNPALAADKIARFLDLELDFGSMQGDIVNQGHMPRFWYAPDEPVTVETVAGGHQLKPGELMLAFSKGTRLWKDVAPEVAAANVDASRRWSRELTRETVQQVFMEHFAKDLALLEADFDFDTSLWRSMDEPVHYADRIPAP